MHIYQISIYLQYTYIIYNIYVCVYLTLIEFSSPLIAGALTHLPSRNISLRTPQHPHDLGIPLGWHLTNAALSARHHSNIGVQTKDTMTDPPKPENLQGTNVIVALMYRGLP